MCVRFCACVRTQIQAEGEPSSEKLEDLSELTPWQLREKLAEMGDEGQTKVPTHIQAEPGRAMHSAMLTTHGMLASFKMRARLHATLGRYAGKG